MTQIHRRVVRVGAVAAWAAATVFLLVGLAGGADILYVQAVGPVVAAGFMTAQIITHKENGGLALLVSALATMVMQATVGSEGTVLPAALALVVICAIGILLIGSRPVPTAVTVALLMVLTPLVWGLPFGRAIQTGVVMSLGLIMTAAVFLTLQNAATALTARFQILFESSPTAVMEEDWSEALAYVRSEYTGKPERLRPFLMAYPAVVERAVGRARIVRVNQAAVDLLEAEGEAELVGYRDGSKVNEHTLAAFVGALVTLYEGRETFEMEVLAMTMRGQPIWLQTRSVVTSIERPGATIVVALNDITPVKERQAAMAALIKAKDEFIASISHELRTPLTAVVGLTSELSSMEGLSEGERAELMGLVAGQAEEMSNIVEDLLVAARAEMGAIAVEIATVSLEAELAKALDGLGIVVDEMPATVPNVVADASRVRQILRNLLTNAVRYGGPKRRILAGSEPGSVWLEVRDDGQGVGGDEASEIFEPYSTAHTGVSGSVGLGLAVARQLAELMGGSLSYRRDADETVFRLELPAAWDAEPAQTSENASI